MTERLFVPGTVFTLSKEPSFHSWVRRRLPDYTVTPYILTDGFVDGLWELEDEELIGITWIVDNPSVGYQIAQVLEENEKKRAHALSQELGSIMIQGCRVVGFPKGMVDALSDYWYTQPGTIFDLPPA